MEPFYLGVEEVARLLSLGRSKIFKMIERGEMPSVRVGRRVLVPADDLRKWVQERAITAAER